MTGSEIEETTSVEGVFLRDSSRFIRLEGMQPGKDGKWSFYPLGTLPENALFVVRPEALKKVEALVTVEPSAEIAKPLASRERTSLHNIIAALLEQMSTKEAAIIDAILTRHPGVPGLTKRTLEAKFAEAKRSISSR